LVILALFVSVNIAAGIDIAIYTESCPWPQAIADEEMDMLRDEIQERVDVQMFTADDRDALATWVQDHTSGETHILILAGILPTSIYPVGNFEPDGSIVEDFLDAGNMIMNTNEYTFYMADGCQEFFIVDGNQVSNQQRAFPHIIDVPEAYVWPTIGPKWSADKPQMTPTADGEKYTPSLEEYVGKYPIHAEDYEKTQWEVELALAENTDNPGDTRYDPCIIVDTETGGRIGVFFQDYDRAGTMGLPRAEVISEYILNYYLVEIAAVEADGKLVSTWGLLDYQESFQLTSR
jgi:hypothetical protein